MVLFVADGLRGLIIDGKTAPTMARIRDRGVYFRNSHALFPTFTTANATAMATGHYLGDTGDFSNTMYLGFPVPSAGNSVTPFLESDAVLGDVDEHFRGDYLHEATVLKVARDAGYSTATIGKVGPTLIFDHMDRRGEPTIVIDDSTGHPGGIPLAKSVFEAFRTAGLPLVAPSRGENGEAGSATMPGTTVPNVTQQNYFIEAITKVILPIFKARDKPFVLVFWSRDPDGTQHNQGDSMNQHTPGINGASSLAAIKNTDGDLASIQTALSALGLSELTDIFITADHGFATISKESKTSPAARANYGDVPAGLLPPGFLAIDIATALELPLFDPDNKNRRLNADQHPVRGNGLIGTDPGRPDVMAVANGGSDLIYLPGTKKREIATHVVKTLLAQDYVSGIFVNDIVGKFPGTLPLSAINLMGSAITPTPAMVVNFRTFSTACEHLTNCMVEIADTGLQQGQGMHGSFGRGDTLNFMAAIGPDFKTNFVDNAPVSNADVGRTLAEILRLTIPANGKLLGRVLSEAMPGGAVPKYVKKTMYSEPAANGLRTVLVYQKIRNTKYFDAAGFPGRTLGLAQDPRLDRAASAR